MTTKKGKLFVVSAPSGAGKTTLVGRVLEQFTSLSYSVSHTTRSPRGEELDGKDYFFITPEEFEEKIRKNHLLEWAKVHDNYYGTSRKFVEDSLAKGKSLLLDIDVQGGFQIMDSDLDPICVFIMPPSFEELEKRLVGRGTDTTDVIARRLENAKLEIKKKDQYQYVLINDNLDEAATALTDIFKKEIE